LPHRFTYLRDLFAIRNFPHNPACDDDAVRARLHSSARLIGRIDPEADDERERGMLAS
jgi:hypothetical protein